MVGAQNVSVSLAGTCCGEKSTRLRACRRISLSNGLALSLVVPALPSRLGFHQQPLLGRVRLSKKQLLEI